MPVYVRYILRYILHTHTRCVSNMVLMFHIIVLERANKGINWSVMRGF